MLACVRLPSYDVLNSLLELYFRILIYRIIFNSYVLQLNHGLTIDIQLNPIFCAFLVFLPLLHVPSSIFVCICKSIILFLFFVEFCLLSTYYCGFGLFVNNLFFYFNTNKKHLVIQTFVMAPRVGLEPTTYR